MMFTQSSPSHGQQREGGKKKNSENPEKTSALRTGRIQISNQRLGGAAPDFTSEIHS
jgi:hypothetical protein